jgi:hypothetical protein
MKKIVAGLIVATFAGMSYANDAKTNRDTEVKSCIQRGYVYFDSLGYGKGNYKLMNGRMRNDEVRIRCERQPKTAF